MIRKKNNNNSDRNRIVRSILYVPIYKEAIQEQRDMYWKRAFLICFQHLTVSMKYELEEPFYEEKGKITNQTEIGGNKSQATYSAEGTMKGNIEVTNKGDFIGVSKANNVTSAQGQGVITTKDGNEKANYTFLAVGTVTEEGKPVFLGSAVWSTDSGGRLAFLNNIISFFKVEVDETGNFLSIERELK